MKELEKYIPKQDKKELFQAFIVKSKLARVGRYKNKHSLSWSDLVNALFDRLIDEENL